MAQAVLIVDDDKDIRDLYKAGFRSAGYIVDTATNSIEAKQKLTENHFNAILSDIYIDGENKMSEIREYIKISPKSRYFTITGKESIPLAVKAMEMGSAGFFPKSLGFEKIVQLVKSKLEIDEVSEQIPSFDFESLDLVGNSQCMKKVFSQIHLFAEVDSTVLITGESGTGKEVVGKALHRLSPRKDYPFEAINCGAIPESLLESELFGHKKGAFTDAKADKKGLFEICTNGTLMLDEIGDMPLSLQVKLLRVLQEREIRPLGGTKTISVNPRILACTHRDLNQLVNTGKFRKDLLFRLSVLNLSIPPLRHRKEDIPSLARVFIRKFNLKFGKTVEYPSKELLTRLFTYDWPGNIRELQNTLERAIVLSNDQNIHFDDLFSNDDFQIHSSSNKSPFVHGEAKKYFEINYITKLLEETKGNISKASRISGKHRVEIYRLMNKHNIHRDEFVEKGS